MTTTVLVAGATGYLGKRICKALQSRGANVRALVRTGSKQTKRDELQQMGVRLMEVNSYDKEDLQKACSGVDCVVSALQGLRDVIVDTQVALLDAAVAAGVPRFIPSDYSLDFTKLPGGTNRNFDFRREFHTYLNKAPIAATSVFNGVFADILTYNTPVLNVKNKSVGYWGDDVNWHLDFTTTDNTAAFTAEAALDATAPRYLNVASFQVSPHQLLSLASEASLSAFTLIDMGKLEDFAAYNKYERESHPDTETELYPKWQSGQYMHDMFRVHHLSLDNGRYPSVSCTTAAEFIQSMMR